MNEDDLYEKAEKEFFDIVKKEKEKQERKTEDFVKADTGKVSYLHFNFATTCNNLIKSPIS